jgi:hypothetical protein
MNNMPPSQAVTILDKAASNAPLTREDHLLVQQACKTLYEYIAKHDDVKVSTSPQTE